MRSGSAESPPRRNSCGLSSATRVGVQEDGEPERRETVGELVDEPLRVLVQGVVERHHGHDVERADVRVHAVVRARRRSAPSRPPRPRSGPCRRPPAEPQVVNTERL